MSESKWNNNLFQFSRLISELNAAGVFTDKNVMKDLRESMDLKDSRIYELVDRAVEYWDVHSNMPTYAEIKEEGVEDPHGHYAVDDPESCTSNAGDGCRYTWRGREFEVCIYNGAGETPAGTVSISDGKNRVTERLD